MSNKTVRFSCQYCERFVTTPIKNIGKTAPCPSCKNTITVPAKTKNNYPVSVSTNSDLTTEAIDNSSKVEPNNSNALLQDDKPLQYKSTNSRNPLLVPFVVVFLLLIICIGCFSMYMVNRPNQPSNDTVRNDTIIATPQKDPVDERPIIQAEPQKPVKIDISEETRNRILKVIECGAKMKALAEQGVKKEQFQSQLAELKGAMEAMSFVGWPKNWNREQASIIVAVDGWNLANEIWSGKGTQISALANFNYEINSYKYFGEKLEDLAKKVKDVTGDDKPQNDLKKLVGPKDNMNQILADQAIMWSMSAASSSFEFAKRELREKINR